MHAKGDSEAEPESDLPEHETVVPLNTARLVIGTIALEAGTKLITRAIDKMVLGAQSDAEAEQATRAKPGKIRKFSADKLAKIATKSKPGAIAVAGGLIAKHLFDRGGKRRKKKREVQRRLLDKDGDS